MNKNNNQYDYDERIVRMTQELSERLYPIFDDLPIDVFGVVMISVLSRWCDINAVDVFNLIKAFRIELANEYENPEYYGIERPKRPLEPTGPTEIRNSYGSLLFTTNYGDGYWLIEEKRKDKLTRVRLYDDGDMSLENFNIQDGVLEPEYP